MLLGDSAACIDARHDRSILAPTIRSDVTGVQSKTLVPSAAHHKSSCRTRIATLDEFRSARDIWNRLVLSMAQPCVFLTWEWFYTWWEHFGDADRELLILFVYRDDQLRAILPLFRERNGSVWFCTANDLYPDHLDIIAAPGDVEDCLTSIHSFLAGPETSWVTIELPMVTAESGIYGWFCKNTARGLSRIRVEVARASVASYISLDGDFESYFASLDKKQRYNIRTRRNRLIREHGIQYVVCPPRRRALASLFELHRSRAQRKGIISSFAEDRVLAFHDAFIARAEPHGWIWLCFLEGPQGPIAGGYNLVFAGRVYSYQKGIDPAWERYGPGTVLLYELVQESFQRGMREYNFLQGGELYKSEWTSKRRTLYTLRLYRDGMAGTLAVYARRSQRLVKRLARTRGWLWQLRHRVR